MCLLLVFALPPLAPLTAAPLTAAPAGEGAGAGAEGPVARVGVVVPSSAPAMTGQVHSQWARTWLPIKHVPGLAPKGERRYLRTGNISTS